MEMEMGMDHGNSLERGTGRGRGYGCRGHRAYLAGDCLDRHVSKS